MFTQDYQCLGTMAGGSRVVPIPPPAKSRAARAISRHLPGDREAKAGMLAQGWSVALVLHQKGRG